MRAELEANPLINYRRVAQRDGHLQSKAHPNPSSCILSRSGNRDPEEEGEQCATPEGHHPPPHESRRRRSGWECRSEKRGRSFIVAVSVSNIPFLFFSLSLYLSHFHLPALVVFDGGNLRSAF